jgi:hypothetical protein
MFKGVSQCISNVSILYFAPFNPSHFFPLPLCLLSPTHTFNNFQCISFHLLPSQCYVQFL